MPRNGSGNYTLPVSNPVISGTPIQSEWANSTMSDVALALTNSLSRQGQGGMLAPFRFANGDVFQPSASFTDDPTSGLYRAAPSDIRMSISGADVMRWRVPSLGPQINVLVGGVPTWANILTSAESQGTVTIGTQDFQSLRWDNSQLTWIPSSVLFIGTTGVTVDGTGGLLVQNGPFNSNGAGTNSFRAGPNAGAFNQAEGAIAIGSNAGAGDTTDPLLGQGTNSVAVGTRAGETSQGLESVAIGADAGSDTQSTKCVAVGYLAGSYQQDIRCVAIGYKAGMGDPDNSSNYQRAFAVAIGQFAGTTKQGFSSVAIGSSTGNFEQGNYCVAIGDDAARVEQGEWAVAIGREAGEYKQGDSAIAIGFKAGRGAFGYYQHDNSIVISAVGTEVETSAVGDIRIESSTAWLRASGANWTSSGIAGNVSDIRLKENVEPITDALAKVNTLNGITFSYIENGTVATGLIAQEVQAVLPEAVIEDADGYLAVGYGNMVGLLVESIKELTARVKALEA